MLPLRVDGAGLDDARRHVRDAGQRALRADVASDHILGGKPIEQRYHHAVGCDQVGQRVECMLESAPLDRDEYQIELLV